LRSRAVRAIVASAPTNPALVRHEVADVTAVRSPTGTAPLLCQGFATAACVAGNGGVGGANQVRGRQGRARRPPPHPPPEPAPPRDPRPPAVTPRWIHKAIGAPGCAQGALSHAGAGGEEPSTPGPEGTGRQSCPPAPRPPARGATKALQPPRLSRPAGR